MSERRYTPVVGGMSLVGLVVGLAAGAAKMAREVARQEAVVEALELVDGVAHAVVDIRTAVLPWTQTHVSGVVALYADGVEEIEELFDECVRVVRSVLDARGDYTARIDLVAEPVDRPVDEDLDDVEPHENPFQTQES